MKTRRSIILRSVLAAVPVVVGSLWLVSGRERLTKHERAVDVTVTDDLFGGTNVEKRFVPGPVFGYYIGADMVVGTVAASLAVGGAAWLIGRLGQDRKEML